MSGTGRPLAGETEHAVGAEPESIAWYGLSAQAALAQLQSGDGGLGGPEVERRRSIFGANELPRSPQPGTVTLFLRQFKNPLVYLLLAASLVSLIAGEMLDALFIFLVLLFNALIGTFQEWQAQSKANELSRLVPHRIVALRDGVWREADTTSIVPGDVVKLESGSQVSADMRLLESRTLRVDESLLTGESGAIAKRAEEVLHPTTSVADRSNMLFAGTTVLAGRATAVAVMTGPRTQIGRIASALAAGDTAPPPLVRQLARFSRLIGIATMVLITIVAAAEAFRGTPLVEVFVVAIALAVAAIPEGLPIAITVALALATNRMQKRNVIVRSLPAVEGLGACTLIATDKTGTLTRNELTAQKVSLLDTDHPPAEIDIGGGGFEATGSVWVAGAPPSDAVRRRLERLAVSAVHCNEASLHVEGESLEGLGDTVDIAFLVLATKLGVDIGDLRRNIRTKASIPYEPERRYAATFMEGADERGKSWVVHVKGAGEDIIPMCEDIDRRSAEAAIEHLASAGYRVIAVARGTVAPADGDDDLADRLSGLKLLGLVGLIDPIRDEVPAAIERCREAGISVRMITGDHPATALAVARQLNLLANGDDVANGQELHLLAPHRAAFDSFVAEKAVFARVEPTQKHLIVDALRRNGHVVAVTGDGVNDAPALNAADIGVAMGREGTDVARSAADLILADDNFASIVAGVEEGRVAYDNVRKLIYLLIATGLGEIVLFLVAILSGLPAPLFAVQLLWLNLVTNGIQDIALAFERGEPGVLKRPPRSIGEKLFNRRMTAQVAFSGLYMGLVSGAAYAWFLERGLPLEEARNLVLLLMVLFENAHALNARSERLAAFQVPFAANWFLALAIVGAQALHVTALFTPGLSGVLRVQPIDVLDWSLVALFALSLILVMDGFKLVYGRYFDTETRST